MKFALEKNILIPLAALCIAVAIPLLFVSIMHRQKLPQPLLREKEVLSLCCNPPDCCEPICKLPGAEDKKETIGRAEKGDLAAESAVGELYLECMPQDIPQAASWFRKAADKGYADAQEKLAGLYVNGWGVKRN